MDNIIHEGIHIIRDIAKYIPINHLMDIVDLTWICNNIDDDVIADEFPRLRKKFERDHAMAVNEKKIGICISLDYSDNVCFDYKFFDGIPIFVKYEVKHDRDGGTHRSIHVYAFRGNMHTLEKYAKCIIKRGIKKSQANSSKCWHEFCQQGGMTTHPGRSTRSWDDVFIPDQQQKQLVSTVDHWLKSEKWYREHKIPYHLGIMLYGYPGTGKSSVVQALTSGFKNEVYYVPASIMEHIEDKTFYFDRDQTTVVVIEDVDVAQCALSREYCDENQISKAGSFTDKQNRSKLASLLNTIDGYGSPENVIWIFTTNHLDRLDPAFIRPGRCDICMEIGYATNETLQKFIKFHYGMEKLPEGYQIKDGIIFSDLNVKVMSGYSAEDILAYVKQA